MNTRANTSDLSPPVHPSTAWERWRRRAPGLALAFGIAAAAIWIADSNWLKARGFSALTVAIVLGMLLGNSVYPRIASQAGEGIGFSKQSLLRLGIVLYGLRLTFQDIAAVGVAGVVIDTLVVGSTFVLAVWLGTRVFGLDRKTAMLIGAGSSICGAAAVMAAEPVVRGRAEQVTVAVATVVVFGTLGMFLYPVLYRLNLGAGFIPMSTKAYGIYTGSTVHEVAQVVAAGRAVAASAADTAVITKMVRVMMLAPFLIALSAWLSRASGHEGRDTDHGAGDAAPRAAAPQAAAARRIVIPWFAVGFIAVAGLSSLRLLPHPVVATAIDLDTWLLAMAMGALGVATHASAFRLAGVKPLALAGVLFAWLIGGGLLINLAVARLFGS